MNNSDITPKVSRLGRPPARKQLLGLTQSPAGTPLYVLRDTLLGLDWPFRFATTARSVARQMLVDNTAQPPCGRDSAINPFAVADSDWEELA